MEKVPPELDAILKDLDSNGSGPLSATPIGIGSARMQLAGSTKSFVPMFQEEEGRLDRFLC